VSLPDIPSVQVVAAVNETFTNSSLLFDKLLLRLMQFDLQYYKDAHAAASAFSADITSLQVLVCVCVCVRVLVRACVRVAEIACVCSGMWARVRMCAWRFAGTIGYSLAVLNEHVHVITCRLD
jgi:hypothetical protein